MPAMRVATKVSRRSQLTSWPFSRPILISLAPMLTCPGLMLLEFSAFTRGGPTVLERPAPGSASLYASDIRTTSARCSLRQDRGDLCGVRCRHLPGRLTLFCEKNPGARAVDWRGGGVRSVCRHPLHACLFVPEEVGPAGSRSKCRARAAPNSPVARPVLRWEREPGALA